MSKHIYSNILIEDFLIKEYLKNKKHPKIIAKEINCSIPTIHRYLNIHKIKKRSIAETKIGINRSKETKEKISKTSIKRGVAKGIKNSNYGGKFHGIPNKTDWVGKNNPKYKDGRTPLRNKIYNSKKYKNWRKKVLERNNYTCQICQHRGGRLEVHHKKRFSVLMDEFLEKNNEFSPINDKEILLKLAMKWSGFWVISNGIILCVDCHKNIHPKIRDEKGRFKGNLL